MIDIPVSYKVTIERRPVWQCVTLETAEGYGDRIWHKPGEPDVEAVILALLDRHDAA